METRVKIFKLLAVCLLCTGIITGVVLLVKYLS
jgi:hypothetical protein